MIRPYAATDYQRLLEMAYAFHRAQPLYSQLGEVVDSKVPELVALTLARGCVFMAEDGTGRVVGFIAGCVLEQLWSGLPILEELVWWVDLEARSGSHGPRLLRSLEDWARQKGVSMVKMVAPSGSSVGAYYAQLGYTAVETAYLKKV